MTRTICLVLASLSLASTLAAQRPAPTQRVTPPAATTRPEVLRGAAVNGFGVPVAALEVR